MTRKDPILRLTRVLKNAICFHAFGVTSSFVIAAYGWHASFLRIRHAESVACISSFCISLPAIPFCQRVAEFNGSCIPRVIDGWGQPFAYGRLRAPILSRFPFSYHRFSMATGFRPREESDPGVSVVAPRRGSAFLSSP